MENIFKKIKNKLFNDHLGVLVFGFPGIGKTYAVEYFKDKGTIADVSNSKTIPATIDEINSLIGKTDLILVESNPELIEAVYKTNIPKKITICAVYPGMNLKEDFVKNLKDENYDSNKLNRVIEIYDDWINYLITTKGKFMKIEFCEGTAHLVDSDIMELIGGSLFTRLYVETYATEKKGK